MKNVSLINPIPKRVFSIMFQIMLIFIYGVIFCTELKAIPEDWPSTDGTQMLINMDDEPMQISCLAKVQLSLDQSGSAVLTPQMLLTGIPGPYGQYKVVVNQSSSNIVSCADIGKVTIATVIDTTNGMMCWSTIVVEDKLKPEIICRADTISCTNDPFAVDYSVYVSIVDNCDVNVTSYYDITLDLFNCSNNRYSSVVHLKWTAIDDHGNTNTCLQDIYFKKSSVDSIVFPVNDTVYCPNADLNLTGVPTLFGDTVSYLCGLLATHVDDSIIVCGGMMKIRRLWTVIDWCTSTMRSETQEILVSDTTRPDIFCPGDTTLYSNFVTCKSNFTIPEFNATDACSPANLLLKVVRVDSSYFLHPGQSVSLDIGVHSFNYIAIDPCGNADTCTSYVQVKDKISPSLICPPALVVSLSPLGYVQLSADFIAGKGLVTDNCCLDTILVRRMTAACARPQDTIFSDIIEFCCDDIGDTLMIVLEAIDCSGNSNFCMIQIYVQDKNPINNSTCPPQITVQCDTNYLDLNITGQYFTITGCLDTIHATFIDAYSLDSCGGGGISRSFFFTLRDGSVVPGCTQTINLDNDYVFNPADVIWPGDTSVLKCINYSPDFLKSIPVLVAQDCGSIYFSYQDLPVEYTIDSCQFIERIWTAYSACNQQAVHDTQIISLLSVDHSALVAPQDTMIDNDRGLCFRFLDLQPAFLTGCGIGLNITNSYNNGGANASGVYQVGTTIVIFSATDLCDTIRDTMIVVVKDLESPDIQCRDTVRINMEPNDTVVVTAVSLLFSYSDNCTTKDSIQVSFTKNNFNDKVRYITCADLATVPDTFEYKVYVEDLAGNVDSCIAVVIVDDTHQYCITAFRIGDVGGFIKDGSKSPMKGVQVDLIGLNTTLYSDADGYYLFNDIITNHEYTILPSNNKNWLEGLSTADIVKIQRHILGLEPFDHPYKWIAADVDKNGRVTAADIVWLRKLILGKAISVPTNQSWRFVNKAYKFKNTTYPLDEKFEEKTVLKGFWKDTIVHFDAIKVGDVTSINQLTTLVDRLRKSDVTIENREFKNGEIFKVDILVEKEISIEGFQMSFDIDQNAVELYRIQEYVNQAAGRNLDQDEYNSNGNRLSIAVLVNTPNGSATCNGRLLSLLFKAKKASTVKDVFTPGSFISNEMYPKEDVPVKILYTYKELSVDQEELVNWYVDPNPFKDRCYIEFQSTLSELIMFNLFDLTGKSVLSKSLIITKGKNTLVIEGDELPGTGTYLYHVRLGDHAYHGKIVKSE